MSESRLFAYRAARADGRISRGEISASNVQAAGALLRERGLHPVTIRESVRARRRHRAAGRTELAVVFRSVASLVGAGVPVERALSASRPLAGVALGRAVDDARQRLREGASLAAALEASGGVVPPNIVGLVAAGERGSQLDRALDEAATQLEQEAELLSRVRSALAYPLVILTVGVASIVVMGAVVVPKFAVLLQDLGQELPASTDVLLAISTFVRRFWWIVLLGGVLVAVSMAAWLSRPLGRLQAHTILLRVPLVGRIRLAIATARTCRALGGMLDAGMALVPALHAVKPAAGDAAVRLRLEAVRDRVVRGERIATSLRAESALASSALQLLHVGESSGRLGLMARRAGDIAAREAELALKTLVNLLEPALVIALGGLVALVAAALLQAVYSLRPGVG